MAAGLHPDLLGELTALPRPLAGFEGWSSGKERGREGDEREGDRGLRSDGGKGGGTGEGWWEGRGGTRVGIRGGKGEEGEGNLAPTVISKSRRLCT